MVDRSSPTLLRRRLAFELRRLRESANLTIDQVGHALECSTAKLSRIENGQVIPNVRDVRALSELYGNRGLRLEQLMQIAREARTQRWWHAYNDLTVSTLAGLEAGAASISTYGAQVVPELLQISDYTEVVMRAVEPRTHVEDVERRVQFCTERKSILEMDDPPVLSVVLDEAALHRQVGGAEVMVKQLGYLMEVAKRPNVALQVLPFRSGAHAGMKGAFTILSFSDETDPEVVYLGNLTSDEYISRADSISRYRAAFDDLRASAASPDESIIYLDRFPLES